ncbi:hypothetical protein EDM56_05855 [Brevibacillus fluminis]|uniref:Pyridoxamine 5'-phosphate oxidase N-terminal domain-containing protein n=1 Tax=Brevibacillus fluminis TaxID=511487 RepID=A0A3M8DSI4_9BACL|nr:pyridoxamine 5'-phosphate oxidase family protein [Brevibacillus fluminis]RNB91108.1 hypothetical protein EDM56_05855 [Brevibacillus fluminis]
MSETVATSLSESLFGLMQQERFLTLATIDHETGAPSLGSISWVVATTHQTVRIAIDNRSRILANLQKTPSVSLHLLGNGSSYEIAGRVASIEERLDGVPLKLAKVEIVVETVRDIMFYGSRISVDPEYEKTYDKNAAAKLDAQVMTALKK